MNYMVDYTSFTKLKVFKYGILKYQCFANTIKVVIISYIFEILPPFGLVVFQEFTDIM